MKKDNLAIVFLAILFAAAFTYYNLDLSKKIGRLSSVTNYDDVVYLSNAADVYFTFKHQGFLQGMNLLFTKSLHAPFTVFNALVGYAFFGFDTERVYFAQITVLLTYLFFVSWFTRRLKLILRISILLASLAVPFAALSVLVFRPDQMSGIVVAGLAVTILTSENLFNKKWKGMLLGIGLGSALLIKSSTFALILLVILGSWLLTAFRMLTLRKSSVKIIMQNGLLVILTTILIAGWYWMQHGREMWAYFIDNSFGDNSYVWRTPGGFWEHLTYYFSGDTIQSSLGYFITPIILLLVGGCLNDILFSRNLERKIIGCNLLWMLVCIFGIYFLQGMKNQYMGGVLYMYLLYGGLFYTDILLRKKLSSNSLICNTFAVALLMLSWLMYRYPLTEKVNTIWAQNSKLATLGLLADLSKSQGSGTVSILFTQGGPVVPEYLVMILKSKSIKTKFKSVNLEKDLNNVIESLSEYEYVVVQDKGIEGRPGYPMPCELWESDLKYYLDHHPEWALLGNHTTIDRKKVYIYVRTSPL